MKASSIKEASRMIVEERGGELPKDMDGMLALPGVGRKIANLILGDVYGIPSVVCDTHCMRICGRFGMYREGLKDPNKIEQILIELLPYGEGSDFCHRIVNFGREVCTARSPKCADCPMNDLCLHYEKGAR
jgi:endonuclease-3